MQEHDLIKSVYTEEICKIKVPPFIPYAIKTGGRNPPPLSREKQRWAGLQAALAFLLISILTFALFSAAVNNQSALASVIAELSGKYEIGQHIPQEIRKLQNAFCITFKLCSQG